MFCIYFICFWRKRRNRYTTQLAQPNMARLWKRLLPPAPVFTEENGPIKVGPFTFKGATTSLRVDKNRKWFRNISFRDIKTVNNTVWNLYVQCICIVFITFCKRIDCWCCQVVWQAGNCDSFLVFKKQTARSYVWRHWRCKILQVQKWLQPNNGTFIH